MKNLVYMLAIISSTMTFCSLANAADVCQRFYSNQINNGNNKIFYQENGIWSETSGGILNSKATGNYVYYLREDEAFSNKKSKVGGVLVVKAGRKSSSEAVGEVTLRVPSNRFLKKNIVKCARNDDNFQKFIALVNKNPRLNKISLSEYNKFISGSTKVDRDTAKLLDQFHFYYKKYTKLDSKQCNARTDDISNSSAQTSGNRAQGSLVTLDTGPQSAFATVVNLFRKLDSVNRAVANKASKLGWTVDLIPYDWKINKKSKQRRACIRVTVPSLQDVELLRINDLEQKILAGSHLGDTGWKRK